MSSPKDLSAEREKVLSRWKPSSLTHFLYGKKETQMIRKARDLIESNPVFDVKCVHFLSREERFSRCLRLITEIRKMILDSRRGNNTFLANHCKDDTERLWLLRTSIDERMPLDLHWGVFVSCLEGLASNEQAREWVPKAKELQWLGCYAQTELGHGSNVRGIETTATFCSHTDEFDVHSPTLSSTKWWVGGLGRLATHAVVFARLILSDGTDCGPHPFLVPIRSLEDHSTLPGIEVGDIGPKLGYNEVDNGYVRFTHVKIPRTNMLSKFFSVDKKGQYILPPSDKLAYASMVNVRANIVSFAYRNLAKTATIAVRYGIVRRQFGKDRSTAREKSILDYPLQQRRVLPQLAIAYALYFTGKFMKRLHQNFTKDLAAGNLSMMGEIHATASALKAFTTHMAAAGQETLRRALGGHGYSLSAGMFDKWYKHDPQTLILYKAVHLCTAEGENYVLSLQASRFLVKAYLKKDGNARADNNSNNTKPIAAYITKFPGILQECWTASSACQIEEDPSILLCAFEHRVARLVSELGEQVKRQISGTRGASNKHRFADVFQEFQVEALNVAKAHAMYVMLLCISEGVEEAKAHLGNPTITSVVNNLRVLFGTHILLKEFGEFLEDGYLSKDQLQYVRQALSSSMYATRKDAIGLVDAFDYSDRQLASVLGRYDGDVYTALFQWAKSNPMNRKERARKDYKDYIEPLIKGKL